MHWKRIADVAEHYSLTVSLPRRTRHWGTNIRKRVSDGMDLNYYSIVTFEHYHTLQHRTLKYFGLF